MDPAFKMRNRDKSQTGPCLIIKTIKAELWDS